MLCVSVLCRSLQDLAWMISFYVRVFLTYVPLLGMKGFLGLLFVVRYLTGEQGLAKKRGLGVSSLAWGLCWGSGSRGRFRCWLGPVARLEQLCEGD